MKPKVIYAGQIGDLCKDEFLFGQGKVIGVFDHVCNIRIGTENGFSLIDDKVLMAPYHIRIGINGKANLRELGIKPEMKINLDNGWMEFPELNLIIKLKDAAVWDSSLREISSTYLRFNTSFITGRIKKLRWYLLKKGKNEGLGGLNEFWNDLFSDREYPGDNLLQKSGYKYIQRICRGDYSLDNFRKLIGLGPGLTPAGDDFLVGWLSVEHFLQEYIPGLIEKKINPLLSVILPEQEFFTRTTFVSAMQLKGARQGNFNEPVINFYRNLGVGEEEFFKSVDTVLKIGSTSGTDIMTGIVFGFAIYL